jgi:hypothetical protein
MKPRNVYQHLRVSYVLNMENFLHVDVSVTIVAILREVSTEAMLRKLLRPNSMNTAHVTRIILTTVSPACCHMYYFIYQYINNLLVTYLFHFRIVPYHTIATWNVSHLNSTHNFVSILYFDIYFEPYILKLDILIIEILFIHQLMHSEFS